MSSCRRVARPVVRSLRPEHFLLQNGASRISRPFSRTAPRREEGPTDTTTTTTTTATTGDSKPAPPAPPKSSIEQLEAASAAGETGKLRMQDRLMDRETTTAHWAEGKLARLGTPPIGSRRRRAALRTSDNVPFEQLPYQCFQEARRVLQEDRRQKLQAIADELAKIKRLEDTPADQLPGGEAKKTRRLESMRKYLEELKILADVNDPLVKRRFEDGMGDMDKPIYRYYAERKWRRGLSYLMIKQRIEQLHIVPDVLPKFEPVVEVQLFFRRLKVEPGEILNSAVTEVPPRLKVQVFNAGERLVSVVVMDSDVPNPETDMFERRCHYLSANVPISPNQPSLPLGKANKDTQLAVRWLPAFSHKGAPYHRLSVFVLEQKPGQVLDIAQLRELYSGRDGFSLKSYRDKFGLTPVGFNIFRTVWDENTAAVMERAGVPGANIEFKFKRVYSLKGEKKLRGWEAKRAKPKYRSLWKYSRRIRGIHRRR